MFGQILIWQPEPTAKRSPASASKNSRWSVRSFSLADDSHQILESGTDPIIISTKYALDRASAIFANETLVTYISKASSMLVAGDVCRLNTPPPFFCGLLKRLDSGTERDRGKTDAPH